MTHSSRMGLAALLVCWPLFALADPVAIVGARVMLDAGQPPTDDVTVLVRDGRIEAVGPAVSVPADAEIIHADGRWLTPGLVASVTRLGLTEIGSSRDTVDTSAEDSNLGADFEPARAFNPNSLAIEQARADGLGHALVVPQSSGRSPWQGQVALVRLDSPQARVLDPAVALAARIVGSAFQEADQSRAAGWQRLELDLEAARDPGDDPHLQAVAQLHAGLPLMLETQRESDLHQAMTLAERFDLRLVLVGAAEAWRLAEELARRDIAVIVDPALNLPMVFDQLGARADNARRLVEAGVRVAFYDSSAQMTHDAGRMLRQGAGLAWASGLDHARALAAITRVPAELWALDDHGLVPGASAGLVLWDDDPLQPGSVAERILLDGRWLDLSTRQQQLIERYRR